MRSQQVNSPPSLVSLLTGGGDKPYALVIAAALSSQGIYLDWIGSDEHDVPEVLNNTNVRFFNLRGDQSHKAPALRKFGRLLAYYLRLIAYAASSETRIFHILWHNKIRWFDRIVLLAYYRLLGKRLAFTAHNVNTEARDGKDSAWNRFTLRMQYKLVHHVFVHTEKMKEEIVAAFGTPEKKISVIPYGINATDPSTDLTRPEARNWLGVGREEKVLLFFGNIAEYKGLDILLAAFKQLVTADNYRLVIAGRKKCAAEYWAAIHEAVASLPDASRVIQHLEFIRDTDIEKYFKAADVLILPYRTIFQSGVLFLGYNFGLPVIATDVGSLKEEIVEGATGFVARPNDPADLARVIREYFASAVYRDLDANIGKIRAYAHDRYSWEKVARITSGVYSQLIGRNCASAAPASAQAHAPASAPSVSRAA